MATLHQDEFALVARYIYEISGIALKEGKEYLIEGRLGGLLQESGTPTFADLCRQARADASKRLERKIVDLITTKETLFFRDGSPFDLLQHKIIPDLIDRRSSLLVRPVSIRIWSAGCATGQEVYSIAIVLQELLASSKEYRTRLLGTDISDAAIAQASYGQYNHVEIDRGLPSTLRRKYFIETGDQWKIQDEVRALASFRRMNLMQPFHGLGKFDIVFCRNVSIYFSVADRIRLFERIADTMEQDGYLVIGSAESLTGVCSRFQPKRYLRSVFYQLKQ
jgi:chemotaxis protein methyltransferase CheR